MIEYATDVAYIDYCSIIYMLYKEGYVMDFLIKVVVCFLAGAGAGIGTGFAGMSAAAVVGPILMTFLDVPAYEAVGIGLISDVLASAVSAYTYNKSGNLDIKNSLPLLFSVLFFTVIGSYVASFLPERTMGSTMQICLLFLGLRFLFKPVNKTKEQFAQVSQKERLIKSIVGGTLIGFICGFVGAGGGMMMLFVLTTFLGYPMHMAVGTSVFIMSFTALTGGFSHFAISGLPDLTITLLSVVFTLLWARVASYIANRSDSKTLNRAVGVTLILTSAVILIVNAIK